MLNKKYSTQEHAKIINDTIEIFQQKQDLPNNIWENLEATKVRTRHIYIRPKVHKKYIPGSPVISSIDFYKTKNFKFIDHYHQPHSTSIQSYFQDTTDFTNKLEIVKDKSKDSILASLNVWAIYTFLTTRA